MMARCMTSEKYGRPVFYGAMITEGIVALIWAAAATYFFHTDEGTALFAASSGNDNAAIIVNSITRDWLGTLAGGLLAVLGVIAAPITSGDTAFRSARLIVADFHAPRPAADPQAAGHLRSAVRRGLSSSCRSTSLSCGATSHGATRRWPCLRSGR